MCQILLTFQIVCAWFQKNVHYSLSVCIHIEKESEKYASRLFLLSIYIYIFSYRKLWTHAYAQSTCMHVQVYNIAQWGKEEMSTQEQDIYIIFPRDWVISHSLSLRTPCLYRVYLCTCTSRLTLHLRQERGNYSTTICASVVSTAHSLIRHYDRVHVWPAFCKAVMEFHYDHSLIISSSDRRTLCSI